MLYLTFLSHVGDPIRAFELSQPDVERRAISTCIKYYKFCLGIHGGSSERPRGMNNIIIECGLQSSECIGALLAFVFHIVSNQGLCLTIG